MKRAESGDLVARQPHRSTSGLVTVASRISLSIVWFLLGSAMIVLTVILSAQRVPLLLCLLLNPLVGAYQSIRLAQRSFPVILQRLVFYSVTAPALLAALLNRLQ
jgi:hypothetical protein